MPFNGYLERLENGRLVGWAWDSSSEAPVRVDFLVDGVLAGEVQADEYRADLVEAGVGGGAHGFIWTTPLKFHDGRTHHFAAMLGDWPLPGAFEVLLPAPRHDVALTSDGRLVGYLLNPVEPEQALEVELRSDGATVARAMAVEAVHRTLFDDAPSAPCGWSFDLREQRLKGLLRSRLELHAPAMEQSFPVNLAGLRGAFRLTAWGSDERSLLARLSTPLRVDGEVAEFQLDGVAAGLATFASDKGGSAAVARLWLEPSQGLKAVDLSASVAGAPAIRVPPVRIELSGVGLWTANPLFDAWDGDRPQHWRVTEGAKLTLVPTGAAGTGSERALRVQSSADAIQLSQAFIGPAESGPMDVHLTARARAAALPATLRLSGIGAGGEPWVESRDLTLWPDWGRRWFRFEAPALSGEVELSLYASVGDQDWIELAEFGCGPEGGRAPRPLSDQAASRERRWNALLGGDWSGWRPPLKRVIGPGRHTLADGWSTYLKGGQPEIDAGLHGLERLNAHGGHEQVFGVRLRGEAATGVVRLEADLDTRALSADPPEWLRFELIAAAGGGRLSRVMLISRADQGAPKDELIATLVGQTSARRPGDGAVVRAVPRAARTLISERARTALTRPNQSLHLVFEFDRSNGLDLVLADVWLGDSEAASQSTNGFVQLEDGAIAAQLGVVRGVSGWTSRVPLSGRGDAKPARGPQPVWRWTTPATSVDVVVCVHNALEETQACLRALREKTTVPHTVIVVDDASDEVTRAALEQVASETPWLRLLRNDVNQGYTRSANIGLSQATAEWVVLLNSDTVVTPGWLEGLLECARSDPSLAMVGPVSNAATWQSAPDLFLEDGRWKVNLLGEEDPDSIADLVRSVSERAYPRAPFLNGFCTLMKRSVVAEVGYLDEATFPVGYGEENDLCLRVAAAGHPLAIADDVYVHHSKSASFGGGRRGELARQGATACRAKHPDVDFTRLQRELAECVPLIELRRRLATALERTGPAERMAAE